MTLEEFENWLSDKDIKKIPINTKNSIEYYCCGHLALELKRNYYGKWILTVFRLVKWYDYEISSAIAMCKELNEFDIKDLDYYFDAYIRQANFLEIYMKKQKIHKKKQDLSKDFS
ncbi:MAG: hypothetical protein J6T10_06285 [Methanobrevibacter sp.]|nr:hypothetical protein [Methanobrevibacter sp.]